MESISLTDLASGRVAQTIHAGHSHELRQTVLKTLPSAR